MPAAKRAPCTDKLFRTLFRCWSAQQN
jgi:hypothetical protein